MNLAAPEFWAKVERIAAEHRHVLDRPRGSTHPRYAQVYPLDYGYLEGTTSGDGDSIDLWHGSGSGGQVTGVLLTVDLLKRDTELKLLIDCTPEDMAVITDFINGDLMGGLIIPRPGVHP